MNGSRRAGLTASKEGRDEERALLCRLAATKFDATAAQGLAAALAGVTDPERLRRVGDWIIECATASEPLARVRGDGRSAGWRRRRARPRRQAPDRSRLEHGR